MKESHSLQRYFEEGLIDPQRYLEEVILNLYKSSSTSLNSKFLLFLLYRNGSLGQEVDILKIRLK